MGNEVRNNYKKLMYVVHYQFRKNARKINLQKNIEKKKKMGNELSKLRRQFQLITKELNAKEKTTKQLNENYTSILTTSVNSINNLKKLKQNGRQH